MKKNNLLEPKAFSNYYDGNPRILMTKVGFKSTMTNNKNKEIVCDGIWDTGATSTAISSEIVKQCKLIPIGKATVHTAGGQVSQNVYLVDVTLPNNVTIKSLRVTEIPAINGANALIGMDIMSLGDMALTHKNNKTIFTFKIPASEEIDFTQSIQEETIKE